MVRARNSESSTEASTAAASTSPRRKRSARTVRVMSRAFSVASRLVPSFIATAAEIMNVRSGA